VRERAERDPEFRRKLRAMGDKAMERLSFEELLEGVGGVGGLTLNSQDMGDTAQMWNKIHHKRKRQARQQATKDALRQPPTIEIVPRDHIRKNEL
jgi:hypothetical protein